MKTIRIKLMSVSKLKGSVLDFEILGQIQNVAGDMTEHDIAARLFAIEFAINNYSEIPMRCHILGES